MPFDLAEVRVGVHQGSAAGEPHGVRVTLVRERGTLERWFGGALRCGVAGPDLRVTVDGEELELAIAGGHEGPISMSGVEMDLHQCRPAMFSSRRGERREPLPESRIVLERGASASRWSVTARCPPKAASR